MDTPRPATRTLPGLALACLGLISASQNVRAETADFGRLQELIEVAYQAHDVAAIEAVRARLLDRTAAADRDATRLAYLAAYARFRQALAAAADAGAASGYLEECIGELTQLVAVNPAEGETRALLGSCYGISTRYHRLAMASRGLAARREMAAARELAPENPWVILQDGLADYATPLLFGGDRQQAIAKLERAATRFEALASAGYRPASWGAAETWQQLSTMYRDTGRSADAARALEHSQDLAAQLQADTRAFAAL